MATDPAFFPTRRSACGARRVWRATHGWRSTVDFAEHDVLRTDDRDSVRDHMATRHFVERCKMGIARRTNLEPVGLVRPIRDQVDAELALRMLDGRIRLALGHMKTF